MSNSEVENLFNSDNTQVWPAWRKESGNYSFQCNKCGRLYSKKQTLHRHEKHECGLKKQFECIKCGKSYSQRQTLLRHQNYECGQEPRFNCPFCSKRSKQKFKIQKHIRMCHQTDPTRMM